MKRSAQVGLLLGGLTTVTVGAAAIAPLPRQNCAAPTNSSGAVGAPAAAAKASGSALAPNVAPGLPGANPQAALQPAAQPAAPCSSSRSSRTWYSHSYRSQSIWGSSNANTSSSSAAR